MSVKTISKDELRRMEGSEGLIIQGCGGSLDEWVDGINDMLTEDGILLDGTRFHDCSTFEHDGSTCLLFPFKDDVKLDVGRLAMWRLQTHGNFGGTWLSDYVPNKLGGFISKEQTAETAPKPDCPLIGQDGNIFNLMGIASRTSAAGDRAAAEIGAMLQGHSAVLRRGGRILLVRTLQIRQRRCATASVSPVIITRRSASSESTSTSLLWMTPRTKERNSRKEWACSYEIR